MKLIEYLPEKNGFLNYPCVFILLFLPVFVCISPANATGINSPGNTIVSVADIFREIHSLPAERRVSMAEAIYKANCRTMPAAKAMKYLDQLDGIAKKTNDKALQCAVFQFRADYYSVNSGYNKLSLSFYQKAIDFAKENKMPGEMAVSLHKMGMFYYTFNRNTTAFPYLLQSQSLFAELNAYRYPGMINYMYEGVEFYYNIGDYYNAKLQLAQILKYKIPGKRLEISMFNTLGLIDRKFRQFPQALNYFNKALRLAIAGRDSAWIGIVTGNIGSVFLLQNNYQKALPYIREDYRTSMKFNEPYNAAIALLRIARISMHNNQIGQAAKQLDTVDRIINKKADLLNIWIDYYDLKAEFYERTGNMTQALFFRKKYEVVKDSLASKDNLAEFERMRLRLMRREYNAQVNELKTEDAVGYVERNSVIAGLFLLMVIFGLIYNRQLLKAKKDKELLNIEKRRVDEELKNSALELHFYTENLKQKTELLERFKTQVESLQYDGILEGIMPENIMTDKNWDEFRKLFIKVHPGFFFELKKNYPHISGTDTRLLALMKLQLNNREMSNMLGITIDGVKKAKQRLRKKVELPAEDTIEEFVAAL
ncbi:hypothetical protein BH09BAC6_BH09BAC6_05220 [soil metagenome]